MTRIADWLLLTRLFIACCAVGLCICTETLILNDVPPFLSPLHATILGSTLFVYNLPYIVKKRRLPATRLFVWRSVFMVLGAAMVAISTHWLNKAIIICGIALALFSLAYSHPIVPFGSKKRLRETGWIKILVLTGVWTVSTAILPFLYWEQPVLHFPFEVVMRFVLMFILCFAFDMKDLQTDTSQQIYTLPYVLGERNSQRLIDASLVTFIVLSVLQYMRHPHHGRLLAATVCAVLTRLAVSYLRRHPSDRGYLGLVDGIMLVYALLAAMPV